MQIQLITTQEAMQETFNQMFLIAINTLPARETTPEPCIINGDELCKKLGITMQTLIRWKHKGKVPYLQIGASIRYDLNKVLQALEVGGKKKGAVSRG